MLIHIFLIQLETESYAQWLFKQSVVVVLLVAAIAVVARYFVKRDEKKDALLRDSQIKHEALLQEQIKKGENRLDTAQDKFDDILKRRDEIAKETAHAVERVADNLEELARELRQRK